MKLMILDGNSIINRTFYGIRMLNAPDGTPTNGVYGFLTVLRRLLDEERPQALCVAFDLKGPTFRHHQYDGYKAQRKPMPEELAVQLPLLKELLDAAGIPRLELEGFEADDLIGTVSRICGEHGWECTIVTGDKDSFQLITDTSRVLHIKSRMGKTETSAYTPAAFFEEYGFAPKQIVDLKALMGDASDNIPGVRGVGEKTAMDLIQRYGTVERIYAELGALDMKDAVRTKLADGRSDAELSYALATIDVNAPIAFSPESCSFTGDFSGAYAIFRRLGFHSLIEKWGLTEKTADAEAASLPALPLIELREQAALEQLAESLNFLPFVAVLPLDGGLDGLELCDGKAVYLLRWAQLDESYNAFVKCLFSQQFRKLSHNCKDFMGQLLSEKLGCGGYKFDTAHAA